MGNLKGKSICVIKVINRNKTKQMKISFPFCTNSFTDEYNN